jgi:hypothetical protein
MHRTSTKLRLLALSALVALAAFAATASPAGAARTAGSACLAQTPFDSLSALGGASSARGDNAREPSAWKNPPIEEAPSSGNKPFKATIPVYFHIYTDGAIGDLTAQQLQNQIDVLNAGYGGFEGGAYTGFSFKLAGVDRTDNANWFYNLGAVPNLERPAKSATHVGGANVLNVWTTNGPGYLGYATFPASYKTSPETDGIVLDYNSFKGGPYGTRFSLAKTGTHEAGHWLGLLHTFQGACNDKGDYVDDTPFEATPTSGCPEGKDTCSDPGLDPIRNYMDYSYDSCYNQFTAGQAKRMKDQYSYFRAGGGTSVGS